MSLGLYIHIPFCRSRCPYCDFAFEVRKTHLAQCYAQAVVREFHARRKALPEHLQFGTVYFGGGTPSHVPAGVLENILDAVQDEAEILPDAEITVEANPGDQAQFSALRDLGINRLSLGVQALTDRALKALGRLHKTDDAVAAFHAARNAGFDNIGIDLIFGAPEQTLEEWRMVLNGAIDLDPEHMSVYGLTLEPNTNFERRWQKGRLPLPSESDQADMYEWAIDRLQSAGYAHYEISNFARPGFFSRHNMRYWEEKPYLGLGLSAHSHMADRRSWNVSDLARYLARVEASGSACESEEVIHANDRFLERVMLGLRQRRGVEVGLLVNNVHTHRQLKRLMAHDLLEKTGNRVRLTRPGLLLADWVCAELVREI